MSKITDLIKNAFGGNKEETEKKVTEVKETVQKTAEKVAEEVKETTKETANQLKGFSRTVAEKAEETAQKVEEKAEETVKSARQAMLEKATQVREKVDEKKAEAEIEAIAKEVIQGKWGNGQERADRLRAAGYDYQTVQTKVNDILHGTEALKKRSLSGIFFCGKIILR